MSLYSILNIPVPTISYCIFHQASSPKMQEEYLATMRELHGSIRRESDALTDAYRRFVRETITREGQTLRGSLSEFLSTPIRSDNAAVQEIFSDSFERFQELINGDERLGVFRSYEGKVLAPPAPLPAGHKLFTGGKSYLRELGFDTLKSGGQMFESVFLMSGGLNLDMIEHIVRDRLGIYATTHGKHLGETSGFTFSAYNLVGTWGDPFLRPAPESGFELALFFEKPSMQYATFREGLGASLEKLQRECETERVSLWQRKLGLGKGKEFILRCSCSTPARANAVMKWILACTDPDFFADALAQQGHLILKEIVAP